MSSIEDQIRELENQQKRIAELHDRYMKEYERINDLVTPLTTSNRSNSATSKIRMSLTEPSNEKESSFDLQTMGTVKTVTEKNIQELAEKLEVTEKNIQELVEKLEVTEKNIQELVEIGKSQ